LISVFTKKYNKNINSLVKIVINKTFRLGLLPRKIYMTYLKITNAKENHFGLQYHDGLIEDIEPFEDEKSCYFGGIHFTTHEYICRYLGHGLNVREVTVPEDANIVEDPSGGSYRSSAVILGPKKSLSEVSTWEWLVSLGTDIHAENNYAVKWASWNGYLEVVKYLVSVGADIHADVAEYIKSFFNPLD